MSGRRGRMTSRTATIAQPLSLLTRQQFKEFVFARDNYRCIVCHDEAKDAHHLIARAKFHDGGYYLDNGVALCYACHLLAEDGTYTAQHLRTLAGIVRIVLPRPRP